MGRPAPTVGLAALLICALLPGAADGVAAAESPAAAPASRADDAKPRVTALVTLEGQVTAIQEGAAEGDLEAVVVELATEDGARLILLGPPEVLAEARFLVEEGDRLAARVFVEEGADAAYVQKVINHSRSLVLRLRTLHREPLWDPAGRWEGVRRDQRRPPRRERPQHPPQRPPERPPPSRGFFS